MGSGLILGGIGKGIAEAGAAYAGGMSKMAEFEMQQQREDMREKRQLELADKMETQKEEKRAAQATAIGKKAADISLNRDVAAVQAAGSQVAGEAPVASKEEILQLIKDNPQYREVYRKAGLIDNKMDARLQQVTDEEQAARESGASPSMVEAYSKAKRDTLTLIAQENKEKRADIRDEQMNRKLDIMEKGANARASNANKPAAEKPITGVDLERTAKAAERALALQIGVPLKDVPETVARLKKQGKIDADTQAYLDEYQTALKEWQGYKRKPKPVGDNTPTPEPTPTPAPANRPPLGSFVRP